ncbi:MAG: alpha/beta hydrolase [Verrucomicrobiota bacterium JB022]|nr:alpha/beta hydrolase [Verrucomicrobiota bacterium JB022]
MILRMTFLALTSFLVYLQARPEQETTLWPAGEVPGAQGTEATDVPTLTPYWPAEEVATGAAIIVCPGGGYGHLATHEGRDYALWLNEHGVTAFVLKYRLGTNGYRHPSMLHDVQRAVRIVRANAKEWELDPGRVGVMGSSAGGHLAASALTHFDAGTPTAEDPIDRVSSRPDLGILCYPVITMGDLAHKGSKRNLLGEQPPAELIELMSNEKQVTAETPPTFLWHTYDDSTVQVGNSILFAEALSEHGVPHDLHLYQTGRHGLGLGVRSYTPGQSDPRELLPWTYDLAYWLKLQGFVE